MRFIEEKDWVNLKLVMEQGLQEMKARDCPSVLWVEEIWQEVVQHEQANRQATGETEEIQELLRWFEQRGEGR